MAFSSAQVLGASQRPSPFNNETGAGDFQRRVWLALSWILLGGAQKMASTLGEAWPPYCVA